MVGPEDVVQLLLVGEDVVDQAVELDGVLGTLLRVPFVPVVALHEGRVDHGNPLIFQPLQIGRHPVHLAIEVLFRGIVAGSEDEIDIDGIIPPPARGVGVEREHPDDQAAIPHLLDSLVPLGIGKGIVVEIVGDASVAGYLPRVIVHLLEPVAGMIHVGILVVDPSGHLPEEIGPVSQAPQIGTQLRRGGGIVLARGGYGKERQKSNHRQSLHCHVDSFVMNPQ
jgi:hypothetical protein